MSNSKKLKEMRDIFTSDENAEFIISSVKACLYGVSGIDLDFEGKDFFDIFNTVASSVFLHESKKFALDNSKTITTFIDKINSIVIREITRYIMKKYSSDIQNKKGLSLDNKNMNMIASRSKRDLVHASTMTETFPEERKYEEITSVFEILADLENPNEILLPENTISVRLNKIKILKETDNITEINNKICINGKLVCIPPGFYENIEDLLVEIANSVSSLEFPEVFFKFDYSSKRVEIFSEEKFSIDSFRSRGLLKTLGFSNNRVVSNVLRVISDLEPVLSVNDKIYVSMYLKNEQLQNNHVELIKFPLIICDNDSQDREGHNVEEENNSRFLVIDTVKENISRPIPFTKNQRNYDNYLGIKVENYSVKAMENPCFIIAVKHLVDVN